MVTVGTRVAPGDVYWVTIPPLHTVGSEQHSRRPFVIVSRLLVNDRMSNVVGLPLTTTGATAAGHPPYRIFVPAAEIIPDVLYTGTPKDSIALTDQVRVLSKARLETKMGKLSDTALVAVGLGLAYLFDLR